MPEKGEREAGALQQAVADREEHIAAASKEHAIVFSEEGMALVEKVGERAEVSFTPGEVEQVRGAAVFTHNHPGGTSFSLPDVLMAKRLNIREMRVVTGPQLYILRAPAGGWPAVKLSELLSAVREADMAVEKELTQRIRAGTLTKAGANREHWHKIWTRISHRIGFQYQRRKR